MDITATPPRADISGHPNSPASRITSDQISVKPDTANPVTAANETSNTTAMRRSDVEPLDVFQVGDNDDIPVPPEPPREAAVLAIMAAAQESAEVAPDSASKEADGRETAEVISEPQLDPVADLPALLKDIEDGPVNPTVDIRS